MPIVDPVTFRFAEKMIPRLSKALLAIHNERSASFREIEDTFGDPISLAKNYIEPYCQQFNPADFDDETRSLIRELLTSRIEHFLRGPEVTKHRQLLILADSGMGKTSCLMILKLSQLTAFWPKPYKVHLLKLGPQTIEKISKLDHRKTVLLLDALDEDPTARGRVTARLTELLVATQKFFRVIFTCRTQFFSAGDDPFDRRGITEVGGFSCPVVYLSLFDDTQVNDYLACKFPNDAGKIARALPILKQMKSLKFRPMLLTHIDDLLDSQITNWTPLTVYEALINAWLHRERRKMSAQRNPEDVPLLADLLKACTVLAKIMFFNGETKISQSEIDKARTFNSNITDISEVDITGRSLLNRNSQGDFRFAHYSLQEYLFCRAIVANELGVSKTRQFQPTAQVFEFIHFATLGWTETRRNSILFKSMNLDGLKLAEVDISYFNLGNLEVNSFELNKVVATKSNFSLISNEPQPPTESTAAGAGCTAAPPPASAGAACAGRIAG